MVNELRIKKGDLVKDLILYFVVFTPLCIFFGYLFIITVFIDNEHEGLIIITLGFIFMFIQIIRYTLDVMLLNYHKTSFIIREVKLNHMSRGAINISVIYINEKGKTKKKKFQPIIGKRYLQIPKKVDAFYYTKYSKMLLGYECNGQKISLVKER